MERETLRVVRAFLRDDPETAQAALERLDASCRRLAPEEDERFGAGARTLDQALHRVVGNAIEYAGAGQTERAFDEFVWAQRTCRRCHALAREQGLLPAKGPLWEDSVTNNRVETTPPAPGAP